MTCLWDRENRRFLGFLIICWLLLAGFLLAFGLEQGQESREASRRREAQIASWLLRQGERETYVAAALKNQQITSEGEALLKTTGRTEENQRQVFPFGIGTEGSGEILLAGYLICALGTVAGAVCFLEKRERLFGNAARIIEKYARGEFSCRLPRNRQGGIYRLFTVTDQLALALRAGEEAQGKAREFLKQSVSDISHQLKTPLAALSMYTEIIREEAENPAVVRKFASSAAASLGRMERLIFMLLRLTRLDAGEIHFQKRYCPVRGLVEEATGDLLLRARKEEKQLLMEGDDSCRLFCDPEWTGEAVGNLVKNALDHTAAGGCIQVRWELSPAMLRISVEDDGEGIAPEDIHHIFKRFYRSRQSAPAAADRQGIGLGLPLAKAIVEGQGGILSVQSQPGQGACFSMAFPVGEKMTEL